MEAFVKAKLDNLRRLETDFPELLTVLDKPKGKNNWQWWEFRPQKCLVSPAAEVSSSSEKHVAAECQNCTSLQNDLRRLRIAYDALVDSFMRNQRSAAGANVGLWDLLCFKYVVLLVVSLRDFRILFPRRKETFRVWCSGLQTCYFSHLLTQRKMHVMSQDFTKQVPFAWVSHFQGFSDSIFQFHMAAAASQVLRCSSFQACRFYEFQILSNTVYTSAWSGFTVPALSCMETWFYSCFALPCADLFVCSISSAHM